MMIPENTIFNLINTIYLFGGNYCADIFYINKTYNMFFTTLWTFVLGTEFCWFLERRFFIWFLLWIVNYDLGEDDIYENGMVDVNLMISMKVDVNGCSNDLYES